MIENNNQIKDKPLFKDYLKAYFLPFPDRGSEKFVENKITKYISYFIVVLYGIILFLIVDEKHIVLNSSFAFAKYLIIAYSIGLVLEIIHWFYAKYDKVEQKKT
jgi:hypothetical protein